MMGQIFTELLELVESKYGYEIVDQLLTNSKLHSGGSYTAVGTYNHIELLILVTNLSEIINKPISELVTEFGEGIFIKLLTSHPQISANITDSFDLLSKIDSYIHVEVAKLYPNAQLPTFKFVQLSENQVRLHYSSTRPFASFAEGLLLGCALYFNEQFQITRLPDPNSSEMNVTFDIVRTKLTPAHG
ncbi:MAG: heme NO-binding domain-containing protein [Oceanospirillaceae bacterium]|nr:heme NO-binding domain-containing protein [Oceanospirillaceae bacterium]